jgi:hypothetical protein
MKNLPGASNIIIILWAYISVDLSKSRFTCNFSEFTSWFKFKLQNIMQVN